MGLASDHGGRQVSDSAIQSGARPGRQTAMTTVDHVLLRKTLINDRERPMPSVSATVDVWASADTVYAYLASRYDRAAHRAASLATKGYVPNAICIDSVAGERLVFKVSGRDPLLRIPIGGWSWSYGIEHTSAFTSRVTITYRWSWWMSLLGAGTTCHQACNEITETAMALDALSWPCFETSDTGMGNRGENRHIVDIERGKPDVTGIRDEPNAGRPRD
jgi:hypothetical protein